MNKEEVLDLLDSLIRETDAMSQEEFDERDRSTNYRDISGYSGDPSLVFGRLDYCDHEVIADTVLFDETLTDGYSFHESIDISLMSFILAA